MKVKVGDSIYLTREEQIRQHPRLMEASKEDPRIRKLFSEVLVFMPSFRGYSCTEVEEIILEVANA